MLTTTQNSTTYVPESAYQQPVTEALPPSGTWRMLAVRGGQKKLPKGLDAWWDAAVGRVQALAPRKAMYMRRAARVMKLESMFTDVSEARLRRKAEQLHQLFRLGRDKKQHTTLAFAVIREIVYRQLGLRLHHEQVAAGIAMHNGCIAELATGEGKTLSATMPAILTGWCGRGCHVITVNDYLAARDAENMRPIYRQCGLTVRHVDGEMQGPDRQRAYMADITYCTNKEVAADFLRDRLMLGRTRDLPTALLDKFAGNQFRNIDRLMLRGLECAIVDEADSVLIDEAVTPLIISGDAPNHEQVEAFEQAADIAKQLKQREHYNVDERFHEVNLTKKGRSTLGEMTESLGGIWQGVRRREEIVRQSLTALHIYKRDKQYVVQDGKIVIVDDFTGRLMPDRTWRDGLHQAVEAKEGLEVQPMKGTMARVSFQRFFRMYRKLSGMTGTAWENRQELWVMFHLPVARVPTHRPVIRTESKDRIYRTADAKWQAVQGEITKLHEQGRPVLVGTKSVGASERLSALLERAGMEHNVLNAVRHAEEAQIVAEAGKLDRITVATNMAGRGTDIKPEREVVKLGGLHVLATERNESRRIDRQLFGRTGRQGDPGTATMYVSLEDELFKRHAPGWVRAILKMRVTGTRGAVDPLSRLLVGYTQWRAQRRAFQQRKSVLKTDDWLEENLGFAGREF